MPTPAYQGVHDSASTARPGLRQPSRSWSVMDPPVDDPDRDADPTARGACASSSGSGGALPVHSPARWTAGRPASASRQRRGRRADQVATMLVVRPRWHAEGQVRHLDRDRGRPIDRGWFARGRHYNKSPWTARSRVAMASRAMGPAPAGGSGNGGRGRIADARSAKGRRRGDQPRNAWQEIEVTGRARGLVRGGVDVAQVSDPAGLECRARHRGGRSG